MEGRVYCLPQKAKIGRPKSERQERRSRAGGGSGNKTLPSVHANTATICPVLREIAEMRVEKGIGRADFGFMAGYDRNQIYNWEAGKNVPSVQAAADLAAALGMRLALVPMEG